MSRLFSKIFCVKKFNFCQITQVPNFNFFKVQIQSQKRLISLYPSITKKMSPEMKTEIKNETFEKTLLQYISEGNISKVSALLENGGDANQTSGNGFSALHAACQQGNNQIVRSLIKHGALINKSTLDSGLTPLMIAASAGQPQVVELLLNCGSNVNAVTQDNGATALIEAAREGYSEIVRMLLQREADVNVQTNRGETAIMIACEMNHQDVVRELLQANPDLTLTRNTDGNNALGIACQLGNSEIAEMLLEYDKNLVNMKYSDMEKGQNITPLLQAVLYCKNQSSNIIPLLVKYHANVEEAVLLSKNWGMNPDIVADQIVSSIKNESRI